LVSSVFSLRRSAAVAAAAVLLAVTAAGCQIAVNGSQADQARRRDRLAEVIVEDGQGLTAPIAAAGNRSQVRVDLADRTSS
jgi:uncharacterized membrane protein affecting hemolysin expression